MTQPIGWGRLPLNSFHLGIEHVATRRTVRVPPHTRAVRSAVVEGIRRIRYTHQRAKSCFSVPGRRLNIGLVLRQQLISATAWSQSCSAYRAALALLTGSRRRASRTFWPEFGRHTLFICRHRDFYDRTHSRTRAATRHRLNDKTWFSMYTQCTFC